MDFKRNKMNLLSITSLNPKIFDRECRETRGKYESTIAHNSFGSKFSMLRSLLFDSIQFSLK